VLSPSPPPLSPRAGRPGSSAAVQTPRGLRPSRNAAWSEPPEQCPSEKETSSEALGLIKLGPGGRVAAPVFTDISVALAEYKRDAASRKSEHTPILGLDGWLPQSPVSTHASEAGPSPAKDEQCSDPDPQGRCQSVPLPELQHCRHDGGAWSTGESPSVRASPEAAVAAVGVAGESPEGDARSTPSAVSVRDGGTPVHSKSLSSGRRSHGSHAKRSGSMRTQVCDLAKSCIKRRGALREERPHQKTQTQEQKLASLVSDSKLASHSDEPSARAASKDFKNDVRNLKKNAPEIRKELTVYQAYDLALKFNLPAGQVTDSWKLFKRYDSKGNGMISSIDFVLLIRSVLREIYPTAKDIPRELFDKVQIVDGEIGFSAFLAWLSEHAFSEHLLLSEEHRTIRAIARRLNYPVPEVEMLKRAFDRFDVDGSGRIEFNEFAALLGVLLCVGDISSLPQKRIRSFWREIDADGSGEVDFNEFIPWYLSYFVTGRGTNPLADFYRNIRRVPFAKD